MSGSDAARFGRSEKYRPRTRHIYALLFENGCCYVGQSTDLKRRETQHRRPDGGWQDQRFTMLHLASLVGTTAQAEDHEYAWRYTAQRAGWNIYGKPPNIRVNTVLRMTPARMEIAKQCRWPVSKKTRSWTLIHWLLGIGVTVAAVAAYL